VLARVGKITFSRLMGLLPVKHSSPCRKIVDHANTNLKSIGHVSICKHDPGSNLHVTIHVKTVPEV
jgi:hypothetical protein